MTEETKEDTAHMLKLTVLTLIVAILGVWQFFNNQKFDTVTLELIITVISKTLIGPTVFIFLLYCTSLCWTKSKLKKPAWLEKATQLLFSSGVLPSPNRLKCI